MKRILLSILTLSLLSLPAWAGRTSLLFLLIILSETAAYLNADLIRRFSSPKTVRNMIQ